MTRVRLAIAAVAILSLAAEAPAQWGGVHRGVNPWTGGAYRHAAAYNPWAGTATRTSARANPWTGTTSRSVQHHNAWTGRTTTAGVRYNPWTGRYRYGAWTRP